MSSPGSPPTVVWFRRDLRLSDNPAWADAARGPGPVVAVYVLDPRPLATAGRLRRDLLLAHLGSLDAALGQMGGSLVVASGDPTESVPALARAVGATAVVANADVSAYARRRDSAAADALRAEGVDLRLHWGSHVHRPGVVTSPSTGRTHRVFTPFHKAWSSAAWEPWVTAGGAPVTPVMPAAETRLDEHGIEPTELPRPSDKPVMEPGEEAAQERLARWTEHVDGYKETHDIPSEAHGTSQLSADLRWGTLSPREVASVIGDHTPGRAAFLRQLAWRDWYAHLLWEHPDLPRRALAPAMDRMAWRDDPDGLAAWQQGRTGFPIVDAGMRQLAATGWMHNRVRLISGSFLVKDLLVDWRCGEAHFRKLLVDFEVSQNVGNWQWVAGTGPDAAPYFRVFNPVSQSRRFDPTGAYIRRWVPELCALDDDAVHAPWEAAPLDLAAANVVLGQDYPHPIVDHGAARERALAAYSKAKEG